MNELLTWRNMYVLQLVSEFMACSLDEGTKVIAPKSAI
jgi:predicted metallopeptidase